MTGRARKAVVKAGRRGGLKKKRLVRGKKKAKSKARCLTSGDLLDRVEVCLDSFRYEEAVDLCVRAVELEPDSVRVLEEAGPVLLELGHADRALDIMKRAAELAPDSGHLKFLYLGQLHSGEEAVSYFTTAILIMTREREGEECGSCVSPDDISLAYCSLAEVYLTDSCFSEGADEKCYNCCQHAVQYGPRNPEAHQLLASCLLSNSRTEEAREAIRTSLSLWLPNTEREDEKSDAVCGGGASCGGEASEGVMSEDVDPPHYFSRVNCAKILMELELHDEAYCVLERLLRDDDEVMVVWYLMGWLHTLLADPDSAHFYLEQASKLVEKTECDDEQMVGHIAELLADLSQQKTEGKGEGEGGEEDNRHDVMDTT